MSPSSIQQKDAPVKKKNECLSKSHKSRPALQRMSHEEESCLKTALAVVLVKQRLQPAHHSISSRPQNPFQMWNQSIRAPLSNTFISDPQDHLQSMMNVATAAVRNQTNNDTFVALTRHLALQLQIAIQNQQHDTNKWIDEWVADTFHHQDDSFIQVCQVWHGICQQATSPLVYHLLAHYLANTLKHLYDSDAQQHDTPFSHLDDTNPLVVQFLILLQLVATKLPSNQRNDWIHILGHLAVPIPISSMPAFYHKQPSTARLDPSTKLLLRLGLYQVLQQCAHPY